MNNKISKPIIVLHHQIERLEELIKIYKNEKKIKEKYECILKQFQDAEKAIVHASTIDKYIRETMIYPFNVDKSREISKRVLVFIRANRPMFIDGVHSEFLEKLQDDSNKRSIQNLSNAELQKIAGMIENEILKRNKELVS